MSGKILVSRQPKPTCVATLSINGLSLVGGMQSCDGCKVMHEHRLCGAWLCASVGTRHTLLVRASDGAVIALGRGLAPASHELAHRVWNRLETACSPHEQNFVYGVRREDGRVMSSK